MMARSAFGIGIALLAAVFVEPGAQLTLTILSGLLISLGSAFGWEER
jgi:hypothetical protein